MSLKQFFYLPWFTIYVPTFLNSFMGKGKEGLNLCDSFLVSSLDYINVGIRKSPIRQ